MSGPEANYIIHIIYINQSMYVLNISIRMISKKDIKYLNIIAMHAIIIGWWYLIYEYLCGDNKAGFECSLEKEFTKLI